MRKLIIHDKIDFLSMHKAGALAAQALDEIAPLVVPGVTTDALNDFVVEFAKKHDAAPAPLFYRGFPKAVCTSINHVICHGIPSERKLKEGDIVNIDITLIKEGWHGDSSRMYRVGEINRKAQRLLDVTYECLMRGIEAAKPGNTTGDIGHAIQSYAESERMGVVRDFSGHGIGRDFHSEPTILHYGKPGQGVKLLPGMFFTIEPMINLGKPDGKILRDGWTAVTRDKSLSAQYEHSIGITEEGCEIFTLSQNGLEKP